ncbi:CPBP family intramembrane glutamic endopeptidase [Zhihengliuella flava]|uniref:Membrane protease YdiL (CAAX protease family) n=1 Tax=Zhihengliuella flava TaxID=1285193 RepID=A0A931DD73_9MICC|nr:CPBP family intramembrane glutamic endopeptidase [Zhihengliuella flava]MBG6084630.1 membrane protease YdiL (CAAX protease family) [Zhihengliuella flava]
MDQPPLPPTPYQLPPKRKQPVYEAGAFRRADGAVLVLYVLLMGLGLMGLLVLVPGYVEFFGTESRALFSVNLLSYVLLFTAVMIVVAPHLFRTFGTFSYHPWLKFGLIPGLWFASIMTTTGLLVASGADPTKSENQLAIESMTQDVPFLTMFFTVAIMGPLVEEYIFRHLLIGKMSRKVPVWICVLISVVAFAALHFIGTMSFDLVAAVPYIVLGVTMSLAYVFTGKSLGYVYVLHAFNNAVSLSLAYSLGPLLEM